MRSLALHLTFLFNLNYVLCLYLRSADNKSELVFTSILFRHGERNPVGFYPNDPYKNLSFWPDGLGMLTKKGKQQQFQLGQWLRSRYASLIPDGKYNRNLIYVRSTDVDRTLMSALADLSGMFYPTTSELWGNIPWQPIPVHTIPENLDKILSVEYPCPKLTQERQEVQNSEYLRLYNEEHSDIYKYLEEHIGQPVDSPGSAGLVWMNLLIESSTQKDFVLPEWAKPVYPEIVDEIGGVSFALDTHTTTLKRLKGGPLLKDMITNMKQKKAGTLNPNRNLWMYSAHDTTIVHFLNTMGVFQAHIPPFAAAVLVELRKNSNEDYFVEVHYKKTSEPTILTIPGCTSSCPLEMFEELLAAVIPGDWDAECQLTAPDVSIQPSTASSSGTVLQHGLLLVLSYWLLIYSFF